MKRLRELLGKIVAFLSKYYIHFVYMTSRVIKHGSVELLEKDHQERYVCGFWHGNSFSFFPFLKHCGIYVVTTKNKRGDYIKGLCDYFGYQTIRVPDEHEGGHYLFKIRKIINGENSNHLALTLDGPLGPYQEPKSIVPMMALVSKRKLVGVTLKCKRKISLYKRWDRYVIPLPFNKIEITVHEPMTVTKKDLKEDFKSVKEAIKQTMITKSSNSD
ncbi:lysophospholipid acyltransferase family protein [Haloplasma contractile]|uniref:DUF374 domain-containing protein n=1 Tax=Haloplasma contractile SSD-17B TaxID=1033810 RepID=U2EF45_9MOLU|nr:DUF374 domain-containing protein [Haloplasma contractile]ERJ13548.1 hypothetical protein HLPCO_000214 [Haloplasma contractile SSD-17B]